MSGKSGYGPRPEKPARPTTRDRRTVLSIAALVAGFGAGLLFHYLPPAAGNRLLGGVEIVGNLWLSALRMILLPLVLTRVLAVVLRVGEGAALGRLGLATVGVFVAMLIAGAAFTVATAAPVIQLVSPPLLTGALLPAPPANLVDRAATSGGAGFDWVRMLVPTNPFKAAADGEILPLLFFTILFGLALTKIEPGTFRQVRTLAEGAADACMVLVGWILRFTAPAVFALALSMSARLGTAGLGVMLTWVALVCSLMVVVTLLLYPVSAILGRIRMRDFAAAAASPQLVAVTTRSSLAALPALLESASSRLRLPSGVAAVSLPLGTAVFKLNRAVTAPARLLFLAYVFSVDLSAPQIVFFVATVILLSFSAAGVPRGGTAFTTAPAYLAVGIPIEGLVLLETIDSIPDIFMTVLNVTADLAAAVLVSRIPAVRRAFAAPAEPPDPAGAELPHTMLQPSAT